jgi:hypothetical protein
LAPTHADYEAVAKSPIDKLVKFIGDRQEATVRTLRALDAWLSQMPRTHSFAQGGA